MNKKATLYYIAAGLAAMLLASCEENAIDGITENDSSPLELSAVMDGLVQSRGNDGASEGAVEFGTYYFTYPQQLSDKELTYTTSACVFTDYIGRIYPTSSPLEWKALPSLGNNYSFRLDNLSEEATVKDGDGTIFTMLGVTLDGDRASKYRATLEGTNNNDIVWGAVDNVRYGAEKIHFDMTHRMSRVSVTVQGEQEALKGNVTVKLTQTVAEAAVFNRVDGKVILPDNPVYEDIVIVDNAPLTLVENSVNTYTTPNLILPPQSLRSGADRPRLEITVGEGESLKTYTGVLPSGMIYEAAGYAATLEFCQGVHLELRVSRLSENLEDTDILFLPAVVRNWDDKGVYVVNSTRQGVYSQEDLENAIKAYNAKNLEEMKKYGFVIYKDIYNFYMGKLPDYYYLNLHANIPKLPSDKFHWGRGKTNPTEPRIRYFNGFSIENYTSWDDIKDDNGNIIKEGIKNAIRD